MLGVLGVLGMVFVLGTPLRERTEGAYEEDEHVGGAIGEPLRPFLFLPQAIMGRSQKGFVLNRMFLWQNRCCLSKTV